MTENICAAAKKNNAIKAKTKIKNLLFCYPIYMYCQNKLSYTNLSDWYGIDRKSY